MKPAPHPENPAEAIAAHLRNCLGARAAIVVDGSANDIIGRLIAAGWTLEEGADYVAGKRVRLLHPPGTGHTP